MASVDMTAGGDRGETGWKSRSRRRATLLGGPLDGDSSPVPLPDDMPWPPWSCHRVAGPWQHYILERVDGDTAATYRYAGECDADNHDGRPLPHEHDACCCGRPGCDGSGPWPHDERKIR